MYRLFAALAHAGERPAGKAVLLVLGLVLACFFLLPVTVHIVNTGNVAGFAFSVFLLVFAVFAAPLGRFFTRVGEHSAGRAVLNVLALCLVLGLLWCAVLSGLMLRAAHRKPAESPSAVIVLGCKVNGTAPSRMLSRRIRAAKAALEQYPEAAVICSGGQGENEGIAEAQCIAQELQRAGIAPERIFLENQSTTTSENLRFSKRILDEKGMTGTLLLATDGFHEMRAQYLAKIEGLPDCAAAPAKTSWYLLPTYWVREWFGMTHALVFGD